MVSAIYRSKNLLGDAMSEQVKIGMFVGREWSLPPAFLDEVNRRTHETGVSAEYVQIGGTRINEPVPYRVIIDRISHEVPYYRLYLKNAVLQGVKVINDPFMWSSDDKFFGTSLMDKLGVKQPRTAVLPNKEYIPGIIHDESLRNLAYPIDWDGIVEYVGGFPCVLKDAFGGGWREVYIVRSMEDLWDKYNQSGLLTMILQEFIEWETYARVMCLGQRDLRVMKFVPRPTYGNNYMPEHDFAPELVEQLERDTLAICRAFGYDMNAVEFAVRNGEPYTIDFMNPAPDMDVNSLGRTHFDWMVTHLADTAIRLALSNEETRARYDWGQLARAADGDHQATAP